MYNVAYAQYILALASNSLTDEIRQNFLSNLKATNGPALFGKILDVVEKMILNGVCTAETGKQIVEDEYAKCGFDDFAQYKSFVETVCSEISSASGYLDRCKSLVGAADVTNSDVIEYGVYIAVLNRLVSGGLILKDLEFSSKVTAYVSEHSESGGTDDFRSIAEGVLIIPVSSEVEM